MRSHRVDHEFPGSFRESHLVTCEVGGIDPADDGPIGDFLGNAFENHGIVAVLEVDGPRLVFVRAKGESR
jgi:hypothetical protein